MHISSMNTATDDRPGIQQEAICYQWFKQRLILSVSEPSISQWSQIKEDTLEPSVPAREFNLKAYAATTWHYNPACLGLKPRLADHRSQAARTAMLYRLRHRGRLIHDAILRQFFINCQCAKQPKQCFTAQKILAWRATKITPCIKLGLPPILLQALHL